MLVDDMFREPYGERVTRDAIKRLKDSIATDKTLLAQEVSEFLTSKKRREMIEGELYYRNRQPDVKKTRTADWQSNTKLKHDFTKLLVNQKVEYLLKDEPTVAAETDAATKVYETVYDEGLWRRIKNTVTEALNKSVAYIHPYVDEKGDLAFKSLPAEEVLPFYLDQERMEIGSFAHIYNVIEYQGSTKREITLVDFYTDTEVKYYRFDNSTLIEDIGRGLQVEGYFDADGIPYAWGDGLVPLVHFRYNPEEMRLLDSVKSLIDAYNLIDSTGVDILADIPNFIYVLKNYDGQNLDEFLKHLNHYRAVKVDSDGGIDALNTNADNSQAIDSRLDRLRYAIYESGRGVDTREASVGDASGEALKMRYANLEMDVAKLESETQSSLQHLNRFVQIHLHNTGHAQAANERLTITFNKNVIRNESELIAQCVDSAGIIDAKTIREHHPWYSSEVEKRLEEEQAELQAQAEQFDGLPTEQEDKIKDDETDEDKR